MAACNRLGDGLFRCIYCKRNSVETYPMETDVGYGFFIRAVSSRHAFHRLDVRPNIQPLDRKHRSLDRIYYPRISGRKNDLRIFQKRRMPI